MEYSAVSTIWIMVGTVLIFFMQAGFAMLETGMTRGKNAGKIAMKNLVDYCIGSVTFWLIGFGIMYGGDGAVLIFFIFAVFFLVIFTNLINKQLP